MDRKEVAEVLRMGFNAGCKEALFTFGEKPEVYPKIKEKLEDWGYKSSIEYLYDLCLDAIDLGLLPHTNPGVVTLSELELLKDVNASMGLMLESSSNRLCQEGMPHEKSPGKRPSLRLDVLKNAGKLRIPFTTGILVGIGESEQEVIDSLKAIKGINDKFGHIQELIIQNFRPKPDSEMANFPEPSLEKLVKVLEIAKSLFPDIGLQVPPNLNPQREAVFLDHGANDFGGISPVSPDYVNPGDNWPSEIYLKNLAERRGFVLRERLSVYPKFLSFAPERLKSLIDAYVGRDGLVNDSAGKGD
jgi:FO synthase subunit 1